VPRFAVVDLETTGLHPSSERIVEFGVLQIDADGTSRLESFLVNPGRRIPPAATRVHGIADRHVHAAPPFAKRAELVATLLEDRVVIGHNVGFDLSFLAAEMHRAGVPWETPARLDTLYAARRTLRALRSHRLDTLREHLALDSGPAHRVDGDITATWHLARLLATHDQAFAAAGIPPLGEIPAWLLQR
jgi:DNA polymerase III epsilon subunit-like protein